MKNTTLRIATLVLIILGSLVANAQSAYYVHFNTGEKQILWTDLVKSMRTSCISVDSTVMADFVTQEIETSDTVYRYPLEAIDSITFRPLPTVYKPGVIKIDDNLFKYVTKCDSLTLYLSDDVPHGILPEPGDLLCTLETNEIFPYGFAGEVARLHDDNGSKIIECTLPDLCDIFESYSSSWTTSEEQPLQSRAYNYGEYPWNKTFDLFGVNANSELLGWLHECVTFDNESYLDISASKLVLDAKLHNNMVFRGSTRIEKGHKLFAMGFTGSHTLDCKSGLSGALSFGKDFEVIEIKQKIPNIPLLQISAAAGALVRATVEADFDAALTQTRHTAFYYSWSNTNDDVIKNTPLTMRTENPVVTFDSRVFGGSIEIGAYIETGFNIFDRDFISLYLRAEPAVVKFDGNFGWPIDGLSIASESTDYYKKLLDNANKLSVVGNVGYGVKTGSNPNDYLSVDFGNSIPVYEKEMMRWYQLPIFQNPRAVRDTEDPYIVDLSVEVERPLIKQYPIGFSIFDDNGDKVISEYGDLYQDGDKTYVTLRIDHLDPSKKYVAYPLMKHKEYEILATPSTDVDKAFNVVTDIPINETTGKELDSRSSDHGYELRGRVIGNWDKEWFTSYGFLITEGSDKSLENLLNDGRYVSATGHYYTAADINFYAGHTELEAATVYSYCAVAYMGEIPVYGNIVEFETEKESIEVTTFTSSITKDAATLHAAVTGISSDDPEVPYGFMIWSDNDTKITLNADNIAFTDNGATFSVIADNLQPNTEYSFSAFYGLNASNSISFRTKEAEDDNPDSSNDSLYIHPNDVEINHVWAQKIPNTPNSFELTVEIWSKSNCVEDDNGYTICDVENQGTVYIDVYPYGRRDLMQHTSIKALPDGTWHKLQVNNIYAGKNVVEMYVLGHDGNKIYKVSPGMPFIFTCNYHWVSIEEVRRISLEEYRELTNTGSIYDSNFYIGYTLHDNPLQLQNPSWLESSTVMYNISHTGAPNKNDQPENGHIFTIMPDAYALDMVSYHSTLPERTVEFRYEESFVDPDGFTQIGVETIALESSLFDYVGRPEIILTHCSDSQININITNNIYTLRDKTELVLISSNRNVNKSSENIYIRGEGIVADAEEFSLSDTGLSAFLNTSDKYLDELYSVVTTLNNGDRIESKQKIRIHNGKLEIVE